MNEKAIRDRLVDHGTTLFNAPKQFVPFTKVREADDLLNDLTAHPHAFVLACVMDRQMKAEKAWLIPYKLLEKVQDFSMSHLHSLSRNDINLLMKHPEPLHRFVDKMTDCLYSAVQRIQDTYAGNAALIWSDNPSSAEVVYRFLQFDGVGPKIGTMATNILARDFKVPFNDYSAIEISADVHIRRVFGRLGLCSQNATVEQVVYKAKALHPIFPGMMDLPCWEIGRNWCKSQNPKCTGCYMSDLCPTSVRRA
ncbi:MAG: iron-sulfur cluster loop [Candidatus Brocadia sp. UTAMX1]|jgi:endonuclease III|nr:MAG: iron-sulfur cluster loop [Candidatus Brocadia sp. UTAMX1]